MLRGNNELAVDADPEQLAALAVPSSGRPGSRSYHWRQSGVASRRSSPTTIDTALSRLATSVTSIRAYLSRLKQLEQWLNERLKAIDVCLGRVRRVEEIVTGVETGQPLPGDCPPYLLLVACYADLARQALHGPSDADGTNQVSGWSASGGDRSDGDVKTSLTPDSLFGPLHDAAMAAGHAILSATDQRVPVAALQIEGTETVAAAETTTVNGGSWLETLTTEQHREYTSVMSLFMSILPPVKKPGRRFGDLLSLLTKSLYQLTRDALIGESDSAADRRLDASRKALNTAELRSFTDFVAHSRPIVRVFSLPSDRKLVLSSDVQNRVDGGCPVHQAPSVLMERLVDVVCSDVTRRFQTETYGAHVVLGQLTRRLDTAPKVVDSAVELARELETHSRLLEMSSRYDNMDALTQSLVTCAVEQVRAQTTTIIDKWKSGCPCRSVYHVLIE